jgi:hypothetical protein
MVLAYALTQEPAPTGLPGGVATSKVESFPAAGLICLYSEIDALDPSPQAMQRDALTFFGVISTVFASHDVIPFRYPTLLNHRAELQHFVEQHAAGFLADLERVKGLAELKVNIEASLPQSEAISGTAYLRAKAERSQAHAEIVQRVRDTLGADLKELREAGERLLLLVPKQRAAGALAAIRVLNAQGVALEPSGPWPPSDFLTYNPQLAGE